MRLEIWGGPPYWYRAEKKLPRWYTIKWGLTRRYLENYRIPNRYGFAYYDFECDVRHYAIIPLNLILALVRHVWFWIRLEKALDLEKIQYSWVVNKRIEDAEETAYSLGYVKGYEDAEKHKMFSSKPT